MTDIHEDADWSLWDEIARFAPWVGLFLLLFFVLAIAAGYWVVG
jgi:hypothetical protein